MYEYLQQIDDKVYERYLTLERNIKAASNSFYDSYLNLQEQFIKTIIDENSIKVNPHETCGALLKRSDIEELFTEKYGLDLHIYNKMGDYAGKTNKHKHRNEKNIEIEIIINYMRVFHEASSCCAIAKGLTVPKFDENYFKDIYGSMVKINERLEELETGKKEILDAINELKIQNQNRQEVVKNNQNNAQILKNFISRAEKKYRWLGTKEDFTKQKSLLIYVQVALIIVGLLSTIISSICFEIYSTYTLFENILLFQMFFLLTYTIKAKKKYNDYDWANQSSDIFVLDSNGIMRNTNNEKKRYKWFRRISYIAVVLNIFCIWTMTSGTIRIFATIFEVAFLALTIASTILSNNFYCMYSAIFIKGYNESRTEKVTIVYDVYKKKYYTLEDYKKLYPYFL